MPALERSFRVFVAASTACFPELPLYEALERLGELEYTSAEIVIHESHGHLKPSEVLADLERAVYLCRHTHRMTTVAYSVDTEGPEETCYEQFAACCKLAKATKVVAVTVRASELGTPFNAEVERLRRLVSIAASESVVVGLLTESGRMTQDPDTAVVLCDSVRGLAITLDPSYYIWGPHQNGNYEQVMKYTCHVRLRDTTKDKFQVRVGQGLVEYGRLVTQLNKFNYSRALCVDMPSMPDVDQHAEMRKMRLLLESLL
jgi:sugar phosphate isomerase/epimerase